MSERERPQGERGATRPGRPARATRGLSEEWDESDRKIDLSIEVTGTPEEVWVAIATGPGVTAWMQPTEIEPEPGGRYAYDLDGERNDTGHLAAYEPPTRFATGGVRWAPHTDPDAPAVELATEWTVEARDGGTCVVRMVMSGFGSGAAWDEEIEGMAARLRLALDSLRRHLAGPGPSRILAAVAVADRVAAMPFYERLFGRPADVVPMPTDAEWNVADTTLQVVEAPDRAGRSLLTLVTDDLRGWVPRLRDRGVEVGEIDETTSDAVRFVQINDAEGNRITLVEWRI
jgi:uncharacterized protein YndB with AHSA1/START domain/predicted enzyme related to lactoylglutathione lyase